MKILIEAETFHGDTKTTYPSDDRLWRETLSQGNSEVPRVLVLYTSSASWALWWDINGVYSLKWRLTDRYLRWGTLAGPRPGRADADQGKSSDFLQELRISGFPRFWVSPTCFPAK